MTSLAVAAALIAASPALAQKDEKKKKKDKEDDINLGGRVFIRDTIRLAHIDGADVDNELSLESVRANIDLRKYGWLRTSIEVSFEEDGEIDLEDVFIETDFGDLELMAGRFKRPMSPITLESAWDLPSVERGILSEDVEIPGYQVPLALGGRTNGIMARYDFDVEIDPEIYLGLFSVELPNPDSGVDDPADLADNQLRDVYARVSIEPVPDLVVGGSAALVTRLERVSNLGTRAIGSLDLTFASPRFRLWLEAFAGHDAFFDGASASGTLLAARALGAARLEDERLAPYVLGLEPYAIVSILDLDGGAANHAFEVGAGLNAVIREHLRLTFEIVHAAYASNYPLPTFAFVDTTTIRIQLGSQFR